MSEWIKNLKKKDDKEEEETETRRQLQLHQAKVAAALAPSFWETFLDAVAQNCTTLADTFPNDPMRQCELSRQGGACEIRGHGRHDHILRMTLNVDGLVIHEELCSDSGDRSKHRSSLNLKVTSQDMLYLVRGSDRFTSAAALAEDVVRRVCEIYS